MGMAINFRDDATLDAVDQALVDNYPTEERGYLGMSSVGNPCVRQLWYDFRLATTRRFDARSIKRFVDGHIGEEVMAKRLKDVPDIELHTHDLTTGAQFGFSDFGGHFSGHMDGAIRGLLQAPKTWCVWEHKQINEDSWYKLRSLLESREEHTVLKAWNETYYAQGQLYMHYAPMSRHYMTISTPGGRETQSIRSRREPANVRKYQAKAGQIIRAKNPPARISDDPKFYRCRWCDHSAICHERELPRTHCRTCAHATPVLRKDDKSAPWRCEKWRVDLTLGQQRRGCTDHLYIPSLLERWAKPIDSDTQYNTVTYRVHDSDTEFKNGNRKTSPAPCVFASAEIRTAASRNELEALDDKNVEAFRQTFDARIAPTQTEPDTASTKAT